MCAKDNGPAPQPPTPAASGAGEAAAREALEGTPLGTVVSRDPAGRARMILGATPSAPLTLDVSAETAARIHLSRHAAALGLHEAAVRDASSSAAEPLAGGASVVQFAQSVNGIEVFHARATVVVDAARNLVSASSTLHPAGGATHAVKAMTFGISPEATLANVYAGHFGRSLEASAVRDLGARGAQGDGDLRGYAVATAKGAPRMLQTTAKRVLFPEGDKLTAAYYIEFLGRAPDTKENEGFGYAISANDGRVLYRVSLTENEKFKYRVWAETDQNNIPMDGPYADYAPHPSGEPDKVFPPFRAPNDIEIEGFNHNPQGAADPWLSAEKTATFGNNVHAYSDRSDTHAVNEAGIPTGEGDGYDPAVDIEADVSTPGKREFLRTYDVTKPPNDSADQIKAAITQIFYVNNWLHDYWYDSGFNEAAGNAQLSNFGRGGKEGDPLLAEAQDGANFGQANNANMTTFAEGKPPRMQMFVWTGLANRKITTTPPLTFDDGYGVGSFGPVTFDKAGDAVLASDGVSAPSGGTPTDGCEAMTGLTGKIAVLDRGLCAFTIKVKNAQDAGAVGVIAINNVAGHAPVSPSGADPSITIPLLILSKEDGQKLKVAINAGAVNAQVFRGDEILHDGTIDNTVVAHEWGHYLHHRLVNCGSTSCRGMSEGWADFNALLMVIREGDTLEGPAFPMAQYAGAGLGQNTPYFGIRRAPYSTDFTKNPFTFKHISATSTLPPDVPLGPGGATMNEVHNVGEIWAQALFEGYVNLQKVGTAAGRSFQETKRRMADYVVAGMKITPTEPTFIEQRDAVLAAIAAAARTDATRKDDFTAIASGFAKRGLGVGAVAPPTSSASLSEVQESMASGGDLAFVGVTLDDSAVSCDHDGILDSGEKGVLKVTVRNTGFSALAGPGTKVTVTTSDTGITLGPDTTIASIDVVGDAVASIPVTAVAGRIARGQIPLTIKVENADAAVSKTITATVGLDYNYDDVEKASITDTVESRKEAWTHTDDTPGLNAWSRKEEDSGHVWSSNHVWHGDDLGAASDERLVSPDLVVGQGNLVLTFEHRYVFENGPAVAGGPVVYFDGGVLEVSSDGGTTWEDVSHYVDPNYPQTIFDVAENGNVLHGRKAWGGASPAYPKYTPVSLNFGNQFAGKTIKLRFRIGTDASAGEVGWDIDNVTLNGITNQPFSSVVDNRGTCEDAGAGTPDSGTVKPDAGDGGDSGLGGLDDSGTSVGNDASLPSPDAGPQGIPARYTNDDSTCAVSPGLAANANTRGTGVGIFAGLMMLLGLRRRSKR